MTSPRLPLALSILIMLTATSWAQSTASLLLHDIFDSRPAADRFAARVAELDAEAAHHRTTLGDPVRAGQIDAIVAQLKAMQMPTTPLGPAANAELYVVGFYEPNGGPGGRARVHVDRPGGPVSLYLTCFESTAWTITASPGTVISDITVESENSTISVSNPAGIPLRILDRNTGGGFVAFPTANIADRVRLETQCLTRMNRLSTVMLGSFTAPSTPVELGGNNAAFRMEFAAKQAFLASQSEATVTRANLRGGLRSSVFTPLLPPPAFAPSSTPSLVFADPNSILSVILPTLPTGLHGYAASTSGRAYVLQNNDLKLFRAGNFTTTLVPGSPGAVSGLAFDGLRQRLMITENTGPGTIREYDESTGQWTTLASLNQSDALAMLHHAADRTNYFLDRSGFFVSELRLNAIDSRGAVTTRITLPLDTWSSFGLDSFQLYSVGIFIAIVGPPLDISGLYLRHCFLVDPLTGTLVNTSVLLN